ncbi:DEAD/DEAH box helicase family protein [Actinomyces howellii]|uniref:Zeta toxin n=1 Tax=Actinomyces howellii TaxID=52771 RepID=A0A3S4SN92_9ACTO|nr:hypothetical protein [Actinomyces howellii]VEG28517.1 Zeta toxin [Actinomyces howellii]VEG28549.1 Zeta toxin [Actinomyces howellii]
MESRTHPGPGREPGTGPGVDPGALERTAAQVQALVDRLAPDHTLPRKPAEGTLWHDLGEAVRAAYLKRAQESGSRSGRALVMAGPPGAGKSRVVQTARQALDPSSHQRLGVDETGMTTVDADDVKQLLLGTPVTGLEVDPHLLGRARAHWQALLADHAPGVLADGQPVNRGALATLVHPMSTTTADTVRQALLKERFDVKIEGTLQWMPTPTTGQGPTLVRELKAARYTQVTVVVADTDQATCLEGARTRWEQARTQADPAARYTPPEAVTSTFTTDGTGTTVSRPVTNARATHELATQIDQFAGVDLLVVSRRAGRAPTVEHTDRHGRTRHHVPDAHERARTQQAPTRSDPAAPAPAGARQTLDKIRSLAAARTQDPRPRTNPHPTHHHTR